MTNRVTYFTMFHNRKTTSEMLNNKNYLVYKINHSTFVAALEKQVLSTLLFLPIWFIL